MEKVVLLSTDTLHHRYFVNYLSNAGVLIDHILFETTHVSPPFAVEPRYQCDEAEFERNRWSNNLSLGDIPISEVENFNDTKSKTILQNLAPTLGIVFGARKLQSEVFTLFSSGLLNVHRGLVQRYRGLDSELWAIYRSDWTSIGVTIHFVDQNLDTGPIVLQEALVLNSGMKIHHLRALTTEIAARLVLSAIRMENRSVKRYPEQRKPGRYYSFMHRDLKNICESMFNQYCGQLNI